MSATRVEVERGGARATVALAGSLEVQSLRFPAGHRIEGFDFDRGYLAVVLDGALVKTFARTRWSLERGSLGTLPAGAVHATAFGAAPTRIVTVRLRDDVEVGELAPFARRLAHVRASASTALGWRLAAELAASDSDWALAAEGLALQLVAAARRADDAPSRLRPTAWLPAARELLHERVPEQPSLSELAGAVGVHPVHLARTFRREHGVGVAEYARTLRLDWAAAQLVVSDEPLARVAGEAGFADQSHFTRAFRRHTGVTPGRYRELRRG